MNGLQYTIGELAERSGLSPHTIRAWEKRYQAISPLRTASNQRSYGPDQIERLLLLKRLVDKKHPISKVAHLSDDELRDIVKEAHQETTSHRSPLSSMQVTQACLVAIEELREDQLAELLRTASTLLGISQVLDQVVIPLLVEIGQRWTNGTLKIHQEHFATSVIRTFLAEQLASINPRSDRSRIIVTTPQNQMHEIGALLVSIAGAIAGWNVIYLGPNLPSFEIADAVKQSHADAIALSIVFPTDDPLLESTLLDLRQRIGSGIPIYVGGSGAQNYGATLKKIDAQILQQWSDLTEVLS